MTEARTNALPPRWRDVDAEQPAGSFTIDEYRAAHAITYRTAVGRLTAMVQSGQITRGQFLSTNSVGKICPRNWYTRKEPAECPSK